MALKSTIYKAQLTLSDLERNHYHTYSLTLARHPSETDERLMVRLLAYALFADAALEFTRGISTAEEPDLWVRDLSGAIRLWLELGQPDEKRIRKACGLAQEVVVICYGGRAAALWWEQNQKKLQRYEKLKVLNMPADSIGELKALVRKSMRLYCTIQEGQIVIGDDEVSVTLEPEIFKNC